MKNIFRRLSASICRRLYERVMSIVERDLPTFANQPKNLKIELPRRFFEPDRIWFGDNVNIGPGSLLVAQTHYPTTTMQHPTIERSLQHFTPRLRIGHRVTSTGHLTLSALQEIVIEDDVMFAANVMVTDGMHGFQNAHEPYKYQPMWRIAPVRIGRGCWIGQNVVIMPGVTIGELSIIGANSVVTHDIPPKSIAVGSPARVTKRWDAKQNSWVDVKSDQTPVRNSDANATRLSSRAN